ncbi:sensor histidine kinase [Verminephrobacter aporrectodeae]|uniref:sensor histidine kinase n=1 Tax=Verminephrobacter aporrectodeae TaxID=1110389 RepID=UPI00223779B6|nr:ATP-binding protein [Verminephrobacter aporrectodeae]
MTQADAAQQLAEMAAAQEELLRAVAHDLRAPLRHVGAYGALVRESLCELPPDTLNAPGTQEALGLLSSLEQSARRMGRMIDGLQALLCASRAPLRAEPIPLARAVAQARATLASAEAGRTVQWRVGAQLPTLRADSALLQELLVQLLGNALKFTRQSAQPCISVHADEAAAAGQAAFTVQDNGAGFDPAHAAQLFGLFQRLHRESEFDGVGAGLALCRAIARRHSGTITASAVPGGGCTVRLEWPAAAATESCA